MDAFPTRCPMRMLVRYFLAAALLIGTGCAHRLIPGTDIERNDDTEAIVQLMERYRQAVEGRDAEAVMKLVSPEFRDNAGTSTPDDDLTYQSLPEALKTRFENIDEVHLDVDVRDIEVRKEDASAVYYYTLRWRMPRLSNTAHSASELKRMEFKREAGLWKIVSGI